MMVSLNAARSTLSNIVTNNFSLICNKTSVVALQILAFGFVVYASLCGAMWAAKRFGFNQNCAYGFCDGVIAGVFEQMFKASWPSVQGIQSPIQSPFYRQV